MKNFKLRFSSYLKDLWARDPKKHVFKKNICLSVGLFACVSVCDTNLMGALYLKNQGREFNLKNYTVSQ